MSFMNVIPGGLAAGGIEPIPNEYAQTISDLGGSHYFPFDESSGSTANDSIGSWALSAFGQRVHRRVIGAGRGTPRLYALAAAPSATMGFSQTWTGGALSNRLTAATGVLGGFFGMSGARTDNTLILFEYRSGLAFAYGRMVVNLNIDGRLVLRIDPIGTSGAAAFWEWDQAAVKDAWKASPGDAQISGSKFPHVMFVQRGNGSGPQLILNGGSPIAPSTETLSGGATSDSWWDTVDGIVTTNQASISFRNSATGIRISGFFTFEGTTPSTSDLQSIHTAANVSAPITDYCEYVFALAPDFWKPPTNGEMSSSASLDDSWWLNNYADFSSFADSNDQWMAERWFRADLAGTAWPISDLPGMGYTMDAVTRSDGNYIQSSNVSSPAFSDDWTAANGFDKGCIVAVIKVPSGSGTRAVFSARTVSGSTRMEFEFITNFMRWRLQRSGGNQISISLDIPTGGIAVGDTIMVVYRQDGTQIDTFVNGVLRDGSDIGTTITGTASGSDWFHTLRLTNRWRWCIGADANNVFNRQFNEPIHDFFITRTVLTNQQIADLWDITKGNKSAVAAP